MSDTPFDLVAVIGDPVHNFAANRAVDRSGSFGDFAIFAAASASVDTVFHEKNPFK